jgi:hypothetical protein
MVVDVLMHTIKHTVPAEKIIVVDDVNFNIINIIMFIYIIIQDGRLSFFQLKKDLFDE